MGEIKVVRPGKTRGYPYPVCKIMCVKILCVPGTKHLVQKRCSLKAVLFPYPYPNPDKMWSKSIYRELSFSGINLRIMQTELKMVLVVVDKVSFNKVLHTSVCMFRT